MGSEVTAVIHPEVILDCVDVFAPLNGKQRDVVTPPREREQQQDQQVEAEEMHPRLLGRNYG